MLTLTTWAVGAVAFFFCSAFYVRFTRKKIAPAAVWFYVWCSLFWMPVGILLTIYFFAAAVSKVFLFIASGKRNAGDNQNV